MLLWCAIRDIWRSHKERHFFYSGAPQNRNFRHFSHAMIRQFTNEIDLDICCCIFYAPSCFGLSSVCNRRCARARFNSMSPSAFLARNDNQVISGCTNICFPIKKKYFNSKTDCFIVCTLSPSGVHGLRDFLMKLHKISKYFTKGYV